MPELTPFLWFDSDAEEAARFYTSVFPNSKIVQVARYGDAGPGTAGSVMTVVFELDGKRFIGLNGGPSHRFTEAVSFVVDCTSQDEVDRYWDALSDGGEEGPCGWLKDRFGLSWQIVPEQLGQMLGDPKSGNAEAAMNAMLQMKKLDIATLEKAYRGSPVA